MQMVPEAGIEPARLAARDFKSLVSTDFTTRARCCGFALYHPRGGHLRLAWYGAAQVAFLALHERLQLLASVARKRLQTLIRDHRLSAATLGGRADKSAVAVAKRQPGTLAGQEPIAAFWHIGQGAT